MINGKIRKVEMNWGGRWNETKYTDVPEAKGNMDYLRQRMKTLITGILFSLVSVGAFANYSANVEGVTITWIKIYNDNRIYFGLSSMPDDHNCPSSYFTLAADLSEREQDRYYSMLLTAYASQAEVQVGYDNVTPGGYCYNTRPIAYSLRLN